MLHSKMVHIQKICIQPSGTDPNKGETPRKKPAQPLTILLGVSPLKPRAPIKISARGSPHRICIFDSPLRAFKRRSPGGRDLQVAVVLVNRAAVFGAQWLVLFAFFFCAQRGAHRQQTCRTRRSAVIAGLSGPRCLVGCHA